MPASSVTLDTPEVEMRRARLPWLAILAIATLSAGALFCIYSVVRLLVTLMQFGIPFPVVLALKDFQELGIPLLIPALIFAVIAFGLWRRWRAAHAAGVILSGVGVAFNALSLLTAGTDLTAPAIVATLLAGIVFGALVATWRYFWRPVLVPAATPRNPAWRLSRTEIALGLVASIIAAGALIGLIAPYRPRTAEDAAFWFAERRERFAEVVHLARSGQIDAVESAYYGGELPAELADLSENGKVASVGSCDGEPVLFLPQWIGIPDDAIGYVHMTCNKFPDDPAHPLDLFGDSATPAVELEDGWWWADGS
jgi:hypothetical protein